MFQPGAPAVEDAGMAPCPEERLLGDVLGQDRVPDHAQCQTVDAALVATHKSHSCLLVAHIADAGQERFV